MNTAEHIAQVCDRIISATAANKSYLDDDVIPDVQELADNAGAIRAMALNEIGRPTLVSKADLLKQALQHIDDLVDTDPYDPDAASKREKARGFFERNSWAMR
jgi:hypothetical protein